MASDALGFDCKTVVLLYFFRLNRLADERSKLTYACVIFVSTVISH